MEVVVRVEITDSVIHLSNERWKASVPYRKLSDGTVIVGDLVMGSPPDPDSPGQWGSKGGSGGGGGGGHGGGGGAPHVPHAPPMPAQRMAMPHAVVERLTKAFGVRQDKLDGQDIIGGGSGRSPRSKYWKRERARKPTPVVVPSSSSNSERSKQNRKSKRYGRRTEQDE